MAEFRPIYVNAGFDINVIPRWQMVPNGLSRYVLLRDGVGLDVTAGPPVVRLTEIDETRLRQDGRSKDALFDPALADMFQKEDRIFEIHGTAEGSTQVRAEPSRTNAGARLDVQVKKSKTVGLRLYFVSDGRHRTNRYPGEVEPQVDLINRNIFYPQSNVKFEVLQSSVLTVNFLLSDAMDDDEIGKHIFPLGIQDEGKNVFFVWNIADKPDDAGYETAGWAQQIGGRNVVIVDSEKPLAQILAHELGHALGLEHVPNALNLMLKYGKPFNDNLNKSQINIINP